ncbi:HD domain-containing protein [Candidatus Woesearchaeota archaeon]|nr:HD domain-containing protein [Candidatus Woesearchaeota archaeon]
MDKPYIQKKTSSKSEPRHFLDHPLTIGRALDCDINLNYASVSRHHAEIFFANNECYIKDLGSKNCTYVNGEPVQCQKLSPGDVITINPAKFIFRDGTTPSSDVVMPQEKVEELSPDLTTIQSIPMAREAQQKKSATENIAQKNFQLLTEAIQTFTTNESIDVLMKKVIEEILKLIPAHNAALFQKNERGILALKVHQQGEDVKEQFSYSRSIIRKVAGERQALLITDTSLSEKFKAEASIVNYDIKSVMCSPLLYHDELMGIIYMDTHGVVKIFDESSLQLLTGISSAAASAIYSSLMMEKIKSQAEYLEKANYQMMFTLANTIEARDHYTAGHTWRVTRFSEIIARMLGWTDEKLTALHIGGVLHDIGKIGVPDSIIQKPAKLTDEEYEIMKSHPKRGSMILKEAGCLTEAIPFILYHHERFDGKGYPYQLKGDSIPIEGRIMAVADAFDAMTSDRPYRKGMSSERAIEIIKENAGTQFDPKIVSLFCEAYEKGLINEIIQNYQKSKASIECPFCSTNISVPPDVESHIVMICPICDHKYKIESSPDGLSAIRAD